MRIWRHTRVDEKVGGEDWAEASPRQAVGRRVKDQGRCEGAVS